MSSNLLVPSEVAEATVATGIKKASGKPMQTLIAGILAGMFISLGAVGSITLWAKIADPGIGKFMGSAIFPVGIMLVILAGSELFTGNCLLALAWMHKKIRTRDLLNNWGLVYLGNLIGSLFLVGLIYFSHLWEMGGVVNSIGDKAIHIAEAKAGLTFGTAVFRGILCNIVVVLSVWIATASKDVVGKLFALWFPITLFVLSGYEHVIANMFFIPMGMVLGADIAFADALVNNFIPVTIGNIIGGAVIVPGLYYLLEKK